MTFVIIDMHIPGCYIDCKSNHLINQINQSMLREKSPSTLSDFMRFLAESPCTDNNRIPPLAEISSQLGVSIAGLREQMEVARSLGFVEARPKTGMKRLPYSFRPAVTQSLAFGMAVEPGLFQQYSDLRNHLEQAYWYQAVTLLTPDDHLYLQSLVDRAIEKINSKPPQLPHPEHRELHLIIYRRLNNPFVIGLLESYWEIYETAGLAIYTDLVYLQQVWQYHARMISAIRNKDFEVGYQALVEHVRLIAQRKPSLPRANFE